MILVWYSKRFFNQCFMTNSNKSFCVWIFLLYLLLMCLEGNVRLILVSSLGWRLFSGIVLIGFQAISYLQSDKLYASLHSFFQRYLLLFWEFISFRQTIVLHGKFFWNTKMLTSVNTASLLFPLFLFVLFRLLYHESISVSHFIHIFSKKKIH